MKIGPARWVCALLITLSAAALTGCGPLELKSAWHSHDITIDGTLTDWRGVLPTYVEAPNIAIRTLNDSSYLYVSLSWADRSVAARMLVTGFTVWFDPEGKGQRTFGIHYPLYAADTSRLKKLMSDDLESREKIAAALQGVATEVEILGFEEEYGTRLVAIEASGIEIALGFQHDNYTYELKVPLGSSEAHPYAIGADLAKPISMALETPEIDPEALMKSAEGVSQGRRAGGPQGSGPGRSDRKGGGGRSAGMRGRQMLRQLEIWTEITLASPSA